MSEFDINKELEEVKIEMFLEKLQFNETLLELEYFYHAHRLGTRVPLFIVLDDSNEWDKDSIIYLCKIGNVLSFIYEQNLRSLKLLYSILVKLLRRHGSSHGIFIHSGESYNVRRELVTVFNNSAFLKSEVCCFVQICSVKQDYSESLSDNYKYILVSKVADVHLQNAILLEQIQRELNLPCLDWNWQYEQSDELFLFSKLVFKNLSKWKNTDSIGARVEGTRIIPMKLMRDDDEIHSPQHVLKEYPNIGLIIDLSNDEGSYDKKLFINMGIEYKRIQIESKVIPSSTNVFEFIKLIKTFTSNFPEKYIVVHCHYGYNRTGLMICAYLIEEKHVGVQEALRRFKVARPPGIKHQNYIDKLILRYSEYEKHE